MKKLVPLLGLLVGATANAGPTLSPADTTRIGRSAARLLSAGPDALTFVIVTEMPSERYVQFAARGQVITFDFPVLGAARPGVEGHRFDVDCSSSPPLRRTDEVESRYLSVEEEVRLKAFLDKAGHLWEAKYCLTQSKDGQRMGYNLYFVGRLAGPKAVAPFVQQVFKEVYRLSSIRSIEIETDE
jgi:hypothetical protein